MTDAAIETSLNQPDYITINRQLAYIGTVGKRREQFCIDYITRKQQNTAAMVRGLHQQVIAQGKSIACSKGCSTCCYFYVIATLQECEVIVYYLYRNEEKLQHFVDRFASWRAKVNTVWDTFSEISRLQQKRMSNQADAGDEQAIDAALVAYRALDNPCPFLDGGACSIYEVRPYVCAALVATTPPEWCRSQHPEHPQARYLKAAPPFEHDVPYFAGPRVQSSLSSLPAVVNELLINGYGFICSLPWLAGLKRQMATDSVMQKALRTHRSAGTQDCLSELINERRT